MANQGDKSGTTTQQKTVTTMNKQIVTDGQLRMFTKRQHELFKRVQKGTIPIQPVLDGLQILIEGGALTRPDTYRKFRIKVGDSTPEQLHWLMNRRGVGHWVLASILNSGFTTYDREGDIDLIILTPEELGFIGSPMTIEIFDPKFLATWSAHNLPDHILSLCLSEVGPQFSDRLEGVMEDETIHVAMDPICDKVDNIPVVFTISDKHKVGSSRLEVCRLYPHYTWDLDQQILFQLIPKPKES
jgi:hypothetical protein